MTKVLCWTAVTVLWALAAVYLTWLAMAEVRYVPDGPQYAFIATLLAGLAGVLAGPFVGWKVVRSFSDKAGGPDADHRP
jgi:hypothetical protein